MRDLILFVRQLAELDPNVIKKLNTQQMIDIFARSSGIDSGAINSDEFVAELDKAEAAEAARQQTILENQAAVQNAQTMSQTDTSGDNMLTAVAATG
jgi:hypothetical protein